MTLDRIDTHSANILIIDDTPANLQLLMGLLSEKGYTVRPIPSGKLAIQGIHLDYPDLILLDISMPEMDGYEVCQKLKQDERTREIPIIFVSAFDEVFDKLKAFEVGGVDYITKPFQAEEVLIRVKTHLSLHRLKKGLQDKTEVQDKKLAEQNSLLQQMNQQLAVANEELSRRFDRIQQAQLQLVQSEKMSTLGQLVAGVAHEINNPVGFLKGNIEPAQHYIEDLLRLIDLYQETFPNPGENLEAEIEAIDLDFVRGDLPKLIGSMKLGVDRLRCISKSLRTFSRSDTEKKVAFNIQEGIDSTLLILKHRFKANEKRPKIKVIKDYGELPKVKCFPGQLNQVFMNLLANAVDALEESNLGRSFAEIAANPNQILIQTRQVDGNLIIKISDNGKGMPEKIKQRIFEQGFTTKAVGKGTGLGLAIARQIIEVRHDGLLKCSSELGRGTELAIVLPLAKD